MAKLHVICGNCGCNDEWEWRHILPEIEGEEETVYLTCENCSTIHDLDDTAKRSIEE